MNEGPSAPAAGRERPPPSRSPAGPARNRAAPAAAGRRGEG